jgi:thiamine-phosphate diphosphorylase
MSSPDTMHRIHDHQPSWVRGLYPILGDEHLAAGTLVAAAEALAGCVSILQLRMKSLADGPAFEALRSVAAALADWPGLLVVNDRADFAHLLDRESTAAGRRVTVGLHLGQTDLSPMEARAIVGPTLPIGLSTHTLAQLAAAPTELVHHLALGPIYPTSTKRDAEPVVGLETLALAARRAPCPLVAIGGITLDRVAAVSASGASAFAVVSALVADTAPDAPLVEHLATRARTLVDTWTHARPSDRP